MSAENTEILPGKPEEAGQEPQIPVMNEKLDTSLNEIKDRVENVKKGNKGTENDDDDKKGVDSEVTVNDNHATDNANEGKNSDDKTAKEEGRDSNILNCRVVLELIDAQIQNQENEGIEEDKVQSEDKTKKEDTHKNNTDNKKPETTSNEESSSDEISQEGDTKSDSSIVTDDLTKGLAQIEIKKCDESDACEKPDKIDIEESKLPEGLIHKVNELDLSEKENETDQNNKSSVDLKMKTESLKNLLVYNSDEDENDDSEGEEDNDEEDLEKNDGYVSESESESESDSETEDSEEDSGSDDSDISSEVTFETGKKGAKKKKVSEGDIPVKAPGEMGLGDLPPVGDLSKIDIDYEKEEFFHMGNVLAVIDTLVTIGSVPDTPTYNLDSCLFYENGSKKKPLGLIYDVIGPVVNPIYCIRFNSTKDIEELNLKEGMKVYSAPKSKYTSYVFLKELMQHKGSDASWLGDVEMPPEVAAAMSDDDDDIDYDHIRPTSHKSQKRKHSSLERHKEFEQSMNRCNTINTRVANLVDAQRNLQRSYVPPRKIPTNSHTYRLPVQFDPTVPPPGFHVVPPFPMNIYPTLNQHYPLPQRNGAHPAGQTNSQGYVIPRQTGNSWQHSLGPGPSTQQY